MWLLHDILKALINTLGDLSLRTDCLLALLSYINNDPYIIWIRKTMKDWGCMRWLLHSCDMLDMIYPLTSTIFHELKDMTILSGMSLYYFLSTSLQLVQC